MSVKGLNLLLIAGHPWEDIDGIRRYSNPLQPEGLGAYLSDILRAQGATTTVLLPTPQAHSVAHLVEESLKLAGAQHFDGLILLASWSSVKARTPSPTKLKLKSSGDKTEFDVEGNLDLAAELANALPTLAAAGFDYAGNYFIRGEAAWLQHVSRIIELADMPVPPARANLPVKSGPLSGRRVVITSGPTAEPLNGYGDVLTNFSSGAQGSAIASAMADAGAQVTLVHGLSRITPLPHDGITPMPVWTADEMLAACRKALPADLFIGVAAVADFAPISPNLSLHPGGWGQLGLKQNPDILSLIGHLPEASRPQLVIGFAAENDAGHWLDYAKAKLAAKNADAVCANYVGEELLSQSGGNSITLIVRDGEAQQWGTLSKREAGEKLVEFAAERLNSKPA